MTESVQVWGPQPSGSPWRSAGGWILVGLGVAGLMLPILPGTPLLIAGLMMLSPDHRWARNCLRRVRLWARKLHLHRSKPASAHTVVRKPE